MKKILLSLFVSFTAIGFAQDLTSNLKVCMPFNGNANDVSGSGNNGTVSGVALTTDRFGNANTAYQFNGGTNDYISIPNFANIAPTNELTISMWGKSDLLTSNCLFALQPDNSSDRCVGCAQYSDGSGATMMIWDYGNISGGRTTVSSIPTDLTNWHHYVYIVSQSGNSKSMYIDGVLKSSGPYTLSLTNKNFPLAIGAGASNGTGGSIRFRGKIDDVCIYNRALNTNEVSLLYSGTNTCFTVGIEELSSFARGIFYPTVSADGKFSYSGDLTKLKGLEIFTVDGKLLESISKTDISSNNGELHLKNYSNGIYFIKLLKEEGVFTQKIVISH